MEKTITLSQAKRMFAISGGNANLVRQVLDDYGYEKSDQVKVKDYDAIIAAIESGVANGRA